MAKEKASEKTLYLVDVSSFIFRAFFAIRPLHTQSGEPTNAVYGVATMLARLLEEARPQSLAITYDSKEPSFRKEIYTEYKANRSETPEDLIPQFARIEQLITAMGLPSFRKSGVEADDLIATLTHKWTAKGDDYSVVIVTGDKDLMQLVTPRVKVWDTMNDRTYTPAAVEEKFFVRPDQIRDYLALVGDSSDNIPGVDGVGPKTAAELLKQWQTLDGVLDAAQAGKIPGKKGETLKNSREVAKLSQVLATVKHDLQIEFSESEMHYQFRVGEDLANLLKELNFGSLLTRWQSKVESAQNSESSSAPSPSAQAVEGVGGKFTAVQTEEAFLRLLEKMKAKGEFGFDLETTSLNPREAELVGIAIAVDTTEGFYIPVGHRGTSSPQLPEKWVMDKLKPLLEDPRYKKVGQNLKYDWSVLREHGVKPDGIGADTMVAAYALNPEGRFNLQTLAERYLNYQVVTFEQVCGKGKDAIGFDQVPIDQATRYSAEDAWIALRLWEVLRPLLEQEKLMEIFARVDLPLVDVLSRMEGNGVCIDRAWLKQLHGEFQSTLLEIEQKIATFTQGPVNLNSPKQLAHLLFEELKLPAQSKTKTGYSTDASVLEVLAPLHEVPKLLLEYREIAKLQGTYVDPLPLLLDKKTNKIHASFHQTVTATGRLSSSDPNLQNIPIRSVRGQKIRKAFIPSEGNVLVAADYSQIELRILAHMSEDAELIRSFRADEDVHRRTASEIYSISPEQVTDEQRSVAKAINFGLMYGKTAFGLAQELGISRTEAKTVIDRYFARYSGVKTYLTDVIEKAKMPEAACVVRTVLGRKRALPDLLSKNGAVRANAERMAMNTPIQGTAADLMKLAMIEIDGRLTAGHYRSKLIIQVHDEVVLDCPKDEVASIMKLVTEAMEGAAELRVPLRVNVASGENWMEL